MKKILSTITALAFLITLLPRAFAAPVSIEVDCVCQEKSYEVYGLEQPADALKTPHEDGTSTCTMPVEVEPTEEHTEQYHEFMDEKVFAPAIKKISEFEDSASLAEFLKNQDAICNAESPLPNCVAERALCSYEKYSRVLFHQSGQPALDSVNTSSPGEQDVQTIMTELQNRDQALFQEVVNAEQALDTAMAVYSQFFETYRLHLRFKEVIAALVKVRNVTSFLRQLVGCIPNKFVGVATTKCN